MRLSKVTQLILAVLVCEAAGAVGSFFTIPAISTWYITLNKPEFTPPNWVFGPAWFTLYALMGIAFYLVLAKGLRNKDVQRSLYFFSLQLLANIGWSAAFFGLHNILLGFVVIVFLWLLILVTLLKFWKISQTAGTLLIPYLAWVSFAALLNFYIIRLN